MLKNYIKIAFRNMKKYKSFTFINITGLVIGITCCIVIMLWVQDELSFDKFHENADNIYRVIKDVDPQAGGRRVAVTPIPLAPALNNNFPEIIYSNSFFLDFLMMRYGEKRFTNNRICFSTPSIFEMFTFPLVNGDPKTALLILTPLL